MVILHRVMFVLFILIPYFTFNGEAAAKRGYHARHHHVHTRHHRSMRHAILERPVPLPRDDVRKSAPEAVNDSFPVINTAAVEHQDTDISKLLSSISLDVAHPTYTVVDSRVRNEVDEALILQEARDDIVAGAPKALAAMMIITGIFLCIWSLHDQIQSMFLRICLWNPRANTTEVVRKLNCGWKASRDFVQSRYLMVRFRKLYLGATDGTVSSAGGKALVEALLQKLPNKYVKRFDILS